MQIKVNLLTLIIPTYNRPIMLENLIKYFGVNNAFDVLILDSSDDDAYELNVNNIKNNFQHIRYSKNIKFKEKLVDGLEKVQTKYCVFCADDDIVSPESLLRCVEFLEDNPDYICAHGYYFGFEGGKAKYLVDDIIYNNKSIDDVNPLLRLDSLYTNYQSNFYSVFRTEVQIAALSEASKNNNSLFFELMQSSYGVISGKVKRLPIIYAGRCRTASIDVPRQWHPVEWVSADINNYFIAYLNYRNNLISIIKKNIALKYDDLKIENIVDLIHAKYTFGSLGLGGLQSAINAQINLCDEVEIINRAFATFNEGLSKTPCVFKARALKIFPQWSKKIAKKILSITRLISKSDKQKFNVKGKINVQFNNVVLEKIKNDGISEKYATIAIYKILERYN